MKWTTLSLPMKNINEYLFMYAFMYINLHVGITHVHNMFVHIYIEKAKQMFINKKKATHWNEVIAINIVGQTLKHNLYLLTHNLHILAIMGTEILGFSSWK